MTPFMARLTIEAKINYRTTLAWQTANYVKAKRLPKLAELLTQDNDAEANSYTFKEFLMARSKK